MFSLLRIGCVVISACCLTSVMHAQPDDPPLSEEPVDMRPVEPGDPEEPEAPESVEKTDEAGPVEESSPAARDAGDPCRIANTIRDAWIDRLEWQVAAAVCNSAVWFDHFFGQGETVDSEEFYGYVGLGMLYKTAGEWDNQSRFDANIPLPNLNKRLNLFVGRGDDGQIVSDESSAVAEPVAPFRQVAGESWLAGLGYSPPGKRGQRVNFRIGGKISSDPYAFAQARFRYNYFPSETRAYRFRQTFFYKTNDQGFGSTTALAYEWLPHENMLARVSGSVTVSEDERGVDWKTFVTVYQDLSDRWGKARGIAYQYYIRGFTDQKITVPEYGLRATYRQQMFHPYLFGEALAGYSWDKDDDGGGETPERKGSWNIGFVVELRFGSKWRSDDE